MKKVIQFLIILCTSLNACADTPLPNQVSVAVTPEVTYDINTGLFTYSYSLASMSNSAQNVAGYFVPLRGATATNLRAPRGWSATVNLEGSRIHWCACEEEGIVIPPNYVDDGRDLPSMYDIKPGQKLAGFSFQSPDPPSSGEFFAMGWVPIPIEGVDFPPGQQPVQPNFPDNLFKGQTQTPARTEIQFPGGRRPAVDNFLVFLTIKDNDVRQAAVLVDIAFGVTGESVDQNTFNAQLNNVDVTAQFTVMANNRRRAYFQLGASSPLQLGRNVITTTVDGTVPGATRSAKDSDRVVFLVQ